MIKHGCFFDCSNTSPNLINCGAARIQSIRDCSIRRGDGLIDKLYGLDSIRSHKSCVSTYASKHHLKRYITTVPTAPWLTLDNIDVQYVPLEKKKSEYTAEQLKAISTSDLFSFHSI